MKKDWHGLLKILEIEHLSASGSVVWRDENLYNIFHLTGEEFLLNAAFVGGATSTIIPSSYYFGLDGRTSLAAADTMDDITGEPSTNGYQRVQVPSASVFTVSLQSGHYRASGPVITFSATGGSWGPVKNLFLTDKSNNTGSLIASVPLSSETTLDNLETLNVRMTLSLIDCP